ncbi:Essential subunit of the histone deacetylase Rpd3S complex, partial [Metarhizium hybridum]
MPSSSQFGIDEFYKQIEERKRQGKKDNRGCYFFMPPATNSRFTPFLSWLPVSRVIAGNKKKKKPAANPARGFATTSIASKLRLPVSRIIAGNKKKKKPAANPARGFATTSIASKLRLPVSRVIAGNKKKKKPASNPARDFATTSIASKLRPEVSDSEAKPLAGAQSDGYAVYISHL